MDGIEKSRSARGLEPRLRYEPLWDSCSRSSTRAVVVRPVIGLSWFRRLMALLMVGALVASCSSNERNRPAERDGVEVPAVDLGKAVHVRTKTSLEQQIGIDKTQRVAELIAAHVDSLFLYVAHRTYADWFAEEVRRSRELSGIPDDEREDTRFYILVSEVLWSANDARTGDIAWGSGKMHDAYVAGLEECARDAAIANVDDMMRPSDEDIPRSQAPEYSEDSDPEAHRRLAEAYDQFAEALGFTRDELLDLRHSCSRYAATLPSLDNEVREDLFRQLHEHYLSAVSAWLAANPEEADLLGYDPK